ncbi:DUF4148 domain-containing protein [Pseudanabaenaceae cyanobacterium LEGE 13415]|nr:DUF4148 domain-containing protein [Pseudanabaenaceae cyanobacterium LEGE 13415]
MKNSFVRRVLPSAALMISAFVFTPSSAHAEPSNRDTNNKNYPQIAQADPWAAQVRRELNKYARAAGLTGYSETHDPFIGRLGRGGETDITLQLDRGVRYAIFGVCDNDCRDIDLALYDDNGRLIASDTKNDDIPIVFVTPAWNARFTIRVNMVSCSNAPCRYGVGAYGQ